MIRSLEVLLLVLAVLIMVGGCGKSTSKGSRVEIREWGLSLELPHGWKVLKGDHHKFVDKEHFGHSGGEMEYWGYVNMKSAGYLSLLQKALAKINPKSYQEMKKAMGLGEYEERSLEEYAREMIEKDGRSIVSIEPLKISGREAVKALLEWEDKDKAFSEARVYVKKQEGEPRVSYGDEVIVVGFIVPQQDFDQYNPLFQQAFQSIEIERLKAG